MIFSGKSFLIFLIFLISIGIGTNSAYADPFTLFPSFVDSFSVASQENSTQGLAFSPDGTKMFVVGRENNEVNEFTLGTAFDVTTAVHIGEFSATEDNSPSGLTFSPNGTKMFVVNFNSEVNEYTLGTPFDVTTAFHVGNLSMLPQVFDTPTGITINPEGTKMFVTTGGLDLAAMKVNEFTLGTAFNVTSASFVDVLFVFDTALQPSDVVFSPDGTKMFVVGQSGVTEYTLGTPFNVISAIHNGGFSVGAQVPGPKGLAFSTDGTKMFVVGDVENKVNEYALGTPFSVFPTWVDSFSITEDANPRGLAFNPEGTKMFVVGDVENKVNEYALGRAFDVNTASFVDSFLVIDDTDPQDLVFSPDGLEMFVVGFGSDKVKEYTLGAAFNVTTATPIGFEFSVAPQETGPLGLAFSPDGTMMFVVGFVTDTIYGYTLGLPFDLGSVNLSPIDSFSVALQETAPQGIAFSPEGTKMFVVGSDGIEVNEYTLDNAFNVTTATHIGKFSVAEQQTGPTGIAFSPDGTKLFVVGTFEDNVTEYILPSFVSCFPPITGNWIVDMDCTITQSTSINNGNLMVENNSVLTILNGVAIDIDFTNHNLTVESGSGILIKSGGTIR